MDFFNCPVFKFPLIISLKTSYSIFFNYKRLVLTDFSIFIFIFIWFFFPLVNKCENKKKKRNMQRGKAFLT